ncbi:MAG: hypothetical protein U9R34_02115 [Nanoarchaeota archaeon]|nr:hypothetical protein [Nanoarchaeota archaeon]
MTNPTQMEMMMWDDHMRDMIEKGYREPVINPTILQPRFDRDKRYPNNNKLKPFIPEPAPLINTYNKFNDDDGYKPLPLKPTPLINTYNKFDDDDDDGYNPFKKY